MKQTLLWEVVEQRRRRGGGGRLRLQGAEVAGRQAKAGNKLLDLPTAVMGGMNYR